MIPAAATENALECSSRYLRATRACDATAAFGMVTATGEDTTGFDSSLLELNQLLSIAAGDPERSAVAHQIHREADEVLAQAPALLSFKQR